MEIREGCLCGIFFVSTNIRFNIFVEMYISFMVFYLLVASTSEQGAMAADMGEDLSEALQV